MGRMRIKIISYLDKIARYIPFAETIKQYLCLLRWVVYKRKIRKYAGLATQPEIKPNILVLMNAGIGNAVEATPLVQAMRIAWPKANITIRHSFGDLFNDWDIIDYTAKTPAQLKEKAFDHTFVAWGGGISANRGYCKL